VIRRLGSGGMAAVYLAQDERLGRNVAVKRMHASDGDDVDARRFQREARLGASLSHPNLVSIFDTEEDEESVLLVMEYVEGETLADALKRGPVGARRTVEIVRAVAEALDHAHREGIVHRDIKPANVLLGSDGSVKLADLGIAKAVERTDITGTGMVLGTPAYMAPEQLQGETIGPPVDVYALAAMTFEMLTGRRPRPGRTAVEIAHQVVSEPPPDARAVNPDIPRAAADAVCAGMAKNAADRPLRAVDFAEGLERGLRTAPPTLSQPTQRLEGARPVGAVAQAPPAAPPPPVRAARSPRWPAIAALLGVALAAITIAIASGGDDEPASERSADRGNPAGERGQQKPAAEEAPAPAEEAPAENVPVSDPGPYEVPVPTGAGTAAEAEQLHLDGHAALEAGDYETAIELNTQALQAFPEGTNWQTDMNYAYALFSLGKALRLAGRPEDAILVLEQRAQIPNQQGTVIGELELARRAAGE